MTDLDAAMNAVLDQRTEMTISMTDYLPPGYPAALADDPPELPDTLDPADDEPGFYMRDPLPPPEQPVPLPQVFPDLVSAIIFAVARAKRWALPSAILFNVDETCTVCENKDHPLLPAPTSTMRGGLAVAPDSLVLVSSLWAKGPQPESCRVKGVAE